MSTDAERRFTTAYREVDADDPGLVLEDDGTVWLVTPDGERTQLPGGWVGPVKINAFAGQQLEDSVAGSVAGGTYTIIHALSAAPPIAWNASAATVKATIETLLGPGSVVSVVGTDVNSGYVIQFAGLAATALLTSDSAGLTGPDAPYDVKSSGYTSVLPLATLTEGDVLEEIAWSQPTADEWDAGATIAFSDSPDFSSNNPPVWAPAVVYDPAALDDGSEQMNNFRPLNNPSTLTDLMTKAAHPSSRRYVPVIASGSVTIYVHTEPGSPGDGGVIWVWAKVAPSTA